MAGNADEANEALVASLNKCFEGATFAVHLFPFFVLNQVVQLNEVDLMDSQAVKRFLELGPGSLAGSFAGLGCQEHFVTMGGKPRCQP